MALCRRMLKSSVVNLSNNIRLASSKQNDCISPIFTNRNPRNLERLRIGYKPDGYYVDKPGHMFWHKLVLKETSRHVTASVVHHQNGDVVKASTSEWCIKKQLHKTMDITAYINLARVLARRLQESGITEVNCFLQTENNDGKLANFIKTLEENGIVLSEPTRYKTVFPWTRERPEKPWQITDTE